MSPPEATERHQRVLLVEDEPELLSILATLLEGEGFSVATACTGPEAVQRARDEHFDVVVSDLKLPGMDGIQVLETIEGIDPQARPVLMTGFVSEDTRTALASHGYPYVLKPFDLEEIVEVIQPATPTEVSPPGEGPKR